MSGEVLIRCVKIVVMTLLLVIAIQGESAEQGRLERKCMKQAMQNRSKFGNAFIFKSASGVYGVVWSYSENKIYVNSYCKKGKSAECNFTYFFDRDRMLDDWSKIQSQIEPSCFVLDDDLVEMFVKNGENGSTIFFMECLGNIASFHDSEAIKSLLFLSEKRVLPKLFQD